MPQELLGKFEKKRCVVVATAKCVWDDLAGLGIRGGEENNGWDVMCVNDIIMHYPGKILHVFSNDRKMLTPWISARRQIIGGQRVRQWGAIEYVHTLRSGARYCWPWPGHGTSTLGAVYTALAMGYSNIVICGAPLDTSPHYFEPDWITNNFHRECGDRAKTGGVMYWSRVAPYFQGRVKSMSGRTQEILGAP